MNASLEFNNYIVWIIAGLGLVALVGVLFKMKHGFGPFNIRAVSIVLVATFAALLGLTDTNALTAAMGILGGIAGYVFGISNPKEDVQRNEVDEG